MVRRLSIVPIMFNGWYVNNVKVDKAFQGSTVTARFIKSSGIEGAYKIRIRRHIFSLWTNDQVVAEVSFQFGGKPVNQDISFSPDFCTNDAGTKGYYAELLKDGYVIWEMVKTYPPRLKVFRP